MKQFTRDINSILADAYHNVLLMEETKRKYSSAGFTFRDRNAITFLRNQTGDTRLSDLADYLKISRPSTTTLVKKLEANGLVKRTKDPANDRNTFVTLTRKGRLFSQYQLRYRQRMAEKISEGFTQEEREVLYQGLCKLNRFFEESINESETIHGRK